MRASLNGAGGARRTYAPSFSGPVGNMGMPNVKVNNCYANGMIVGQTIMAGIGLLNQLGALGGGDGVKSSSLGDKLSTAFSSIGGGSAASSSISGSISTMDAATDSASLRSAISGAEGQLSTMNGLTQVLTDAAETAKGQIDGLEGAVKDGENTVKDNKQKVSNAKNTVTARTNNRDNKQNALAKADANYAKAVDSYTKAHDASVNAKLSYDSAVQVKGLAQQDYNSAKAAYEAMPDTLPDGTTNIAKKQAEEAMKAAKTRLDAATENEEKAKKEMDAANEAEDKALQAKNKAYENVTANKEAVDAAEA
jgi:chromosome segregation ATPase